MDERGTMSWKAFSIRLIEALRWPVAVVVIYYLLRQPIGHLIDAVADNFLH